MKRKIFAVCLAILIVVSCGMFCGCTESPDKYTLEQHMERISERVEKRYINDDTRNQTYSFITDYKLYPLYDENDKLAYFLIEFEPYGFAFVAMSETTRYFGMYFRTDKFVTSTWFRYRLCIDGIEPEPYQGKQWVAMERNDSVIYNNEENFRYETDENDVLKIYNQSPYNIASVLDRKLYLLELYGGGYVPAIKQNGNYINLISMQEFDYIGDSQYYKQLGEVYIAKNIPYLPFGFIIKQEL